MAVIDSLPGLACYILVDGQPLKEYDPPASDKIQEGGPVVKYVEAQTGKRFRVKCSFDDRLDLSVPGYVMELLFRPDTTANAILRGKKLKTLREMTVSTFWQLSNPGCDWYLTFSDAQISDRESPAGAGDERCRLIGSLTVEIYRLAKIRTSKMHINKRRQRETRQRNKRSNEDNSSSEMSRHEPNNFCADEVDDETNMVPEKKVKARAISHDVTGQGKHDYVGKFFDTVCNPTKPIATFRFEYRSLKSLKELGIVPRTPVSTPEPIIIDDDGPDDVENISIEELRAFWVAHRNRYNNVKHENIETTNAGSAIKEEQSQESQEFQELVTTLKAKSTIESRQESDIAETNDVELVGRSHKRKLDCIIDLVND